MFDAVVMKWVLFFFFLCWGSDPRPCACWASALQLSHIPTPRTVFSISFFNCSVWVCRKCNLLLCLDLLSCSLVELVYSNGFLHLWTERALLPPFSYEGLFLLSSDCPGDGSFLRCEWSTRCLCRLPHFAGAFRLSSLGMKSAVGSSQGVGCLWLERMWVGEMLFLHPLEWSCGSCPLFLSIRCYINWFFDVESTSHSWDKSRLVMVYSSFYVTGSALLACCWFFPLYS